MRKQRQTQEGRCLGKVSGKKKGVGKAQHGDTRSAARGRVEGQIQLKFATKVPLSGSLHRAKGGTPLKELLLPENGTN